MIVIRRIIQYKVILIPLFILLGVSAVRVNDPDLLASFRNQVFDAYQVAVPRESANRSVSVGAIDEKSLRKLGQWPWPRVLFSDILKKLREKGAVVVAFDVLFAEQDRFSPANIASYYRRFGEDKIEASSLGRQFPDGDLILANELKLSRAVMAVAPLNPGISKYNLTGMRAPVLIKGDEGKMQLPLYREAVSSLPAFNKAAAGIGSISLEREGDGVVRRLPLFSKVGKTLVPALGLEALRLAVRGRGYFLIGDQSGITGVTMPPHFAFETEGNSALRVRWEKFNTETYFSIADLIDDTVPDHIIKNKIVIIGANATGLYDFKKTPIKDNTPGVEIHRQFIETLISGTAPLRQDYFTPLEIFFVIIILIINLYLVIKTKPFVWLSGFLMFFGLIPVLSFYSFKHYNLLIDPSFPLATFVVSMTAAFLLKFRDEFKEKIAIKQQFAGYTSPTVVRLLQENPRLVKDGVKKEISICFSDLRGFTPLGESFGDDVKGLTELMNGYMDAITQPILDQYGMVIKYIGDASVHIHNAPIDDSDHPKSAVKAGLLMLDAVEKFNKKITSEGHPPVAMGAGINTGLAYLGEMGSSARHSYDVLGDAVSTAARIESKCKEYGCLLLVGEATYDKTEDEFFYLKVDDLAVKGKSVGTRIYTVLSDMDFMMKNTDWGWAEKQHKRMHELYMEQKFDLAIKSCNELYNEFDGKMQGYYDMWIERCEFMKNQPLPEDWNGVFIATTK